MGKGEETRERIVTAGLKLFSEKGVHGVVFQDLANLVGITQAGIYKHFPDKESLLLACCLSAVSTARSFVDRRINPADPAVKRLKSYIRANLDWIIELQREASAFLAMFYFASLNEDILAVHNQIDEFSIVRIQTHLIQGNREGAWLVQEPPFAARAIHDFMTGESINRLLKKSPSALFQIA